ncbi:MAG: hypothetical protein ACI86H_002399 [bacterium]|jgi:hypothetical protein
MSSIRFPYQTNKKIILSAIALMGAIAGVFLKLALENDRGLIINRIIKLSVQSATIFYWSLAIFVLSIVVLASFAVIRNIVEKREIILTDTSISSPKSGISSKIISIQFQDIIDIEVQKIQSQQYLYLFYPDGKLTIPQIMLPDKKIFEELVKQVTERIVYFKNLDSK